MTPQSKKSPDPLAPPFLSADDLRAHTFVRHVEIHDTLDSTNNRAAELSRDNNVELPALVAARLQTAGRGRGANKWWSADGALTFSLLIDPATHGITTATWPQLSLTTAVAVCDALQTQLTPQRAGSSPTPAGPRLGIKWPNDVLVDNRKIAGILIESPGGAAPAKDRLILGIGINVNNACHQAACGLAPTLATSPNATSLRDISHTEHNLPQILTDVLRALESRMTQLAIHDPQLPATWKRLDCLAGQLIAVTHNSSTATTHCLGISEDGVLLVQLATTTAQLYSGTVRLA
jgi:BirA family biotin operon repressor/biotin-[acetyl-CoA-carboxylase] ligase